MLKALLGVIPCLEYLLFVNQGHAASKKKTNKYDEINGHHMQSIATMCTHSQ